MLAARLAGRAVRRGGCCVWSARSFDVLRNAPPAHLDILRQDLRYTARTRAEPRLYADGDPGDRAGHRANTAAFSLADYVLIRPLPFPEPDRLVKCGRTCPATRGWSSRRPIIATGQHMNGAFAAMGAFNRNRGIWWSGAPRSGSKARR